MAPTRKASTKRPSASLTHSWEKLQAELANTCQTPVPRSRTTAGMRTRNPTKGTVPANSATASGRELECARKPASISVSPPPSHTIAESTWTKSNQETMSIAPPKRFHHTKMLGGLQLSDSINDRVLPRRLVVPYDPDMAGKERAAREAWRAIFDFIVATSAERNATLGRAGLTPNDARTLARIADRKSTR